MKKVLCVLATFGVAIALGYGVSRAVEQKEQKPKYSIKEVMGEAHKSKLVNKVQEGKATPEEKQKLLSHYIALWESKPPKGTQESWNEKTGALVVAGAKALLGEEDASESLKNAANCGACHKAHKP